ncbi:ring-box protein 1 [Vairimorpha apis BRL 01]|uniref:Ring-box protein 1 n=1 Tax=Vairimorpha apis BRL 01 TaxID=1037528 RepID=T0L006_9MICR|nr:ring-box protein 1 [Vairimorpha apis BRL 01]
MHEKPIIKIKKVNLVGMWSPDMQVETCAICRNHIGDTCVECQNGLKRGEVCSVSWGTCNHAFHSHCITRWLMSKNVCPLDTKPWEYYKP